MSRATTATVDARQLSFDDARQQAVQGAARAVTTGHRHPTTSRQAAEKAAPRAAAQWLRALRYVALTGPVTDFQIAEGAHMSMDAVRPRRGALVSQGYVAAVGEDGLSPSGNAATRYVVTEAGLALLKGLGLEVDE